MFFVFIFFSRNHLIGVLITAKTLLKIRDWKLDIGDKKLQSSEGAKFTSVWVKPIAEKVEELGVRC